MNTTARYTLGKNERLKSRKQIEILFKKGKSFSVFPFRIVYIIEEAGLSTNVAPTLPKRLLQAGFSVSSRNFKKSVDRNKIKRLSREAYRLQKNDVMQQLDLDNKKLILFFIYTGNEIPTYDVVYTKIGKGLAQLQKHIHEKTVANS